MADPRDLPPVSKESCAAFIAAADTYLRQHGGQSKADTRDVEREGRKAAGLRRLEAPSFALVEEALSCIPNDDLPYDEWFRVGLALYAALGAEGRVLWEEWSAQAAKNDAACSADKWDSFSEVRNITVGTLFWVARSHGWRAEKPHSPDAKPAQTDHDGHTTEDDSRPTIRVYAGFLHETVDNAA